MKRTFDIVLSVSGLLLLSPLLIIVALAILLTDGSPVFFRQQRVGRHGTPFHIWKFRTMVVDAEKIGSSLTVGRDPRITRIGHWLRKTKLDELPQLFNVLLGEMSLVGPRPEVQRYVDQYTDQQRVVLDMKPGITDPASIAYFNESELLAQSDSPNDYYLSHVMPEKIRINLEYHKKASLATDLRIIASTLRRMVA